MKTRYLIRHAKSDWSDPLLDDFDRGLNERGKLDAPLMGEVLSRKLISPNLILSSPALRAKLTAQIIAEKLSYPIDTIVFERSLYASEPETLFALIRQIPDTIDTLMIFGHNPELTESLNLLCGTMIENIPTCGAAAMRLYDKSWKNIGPDSAELLFLERPKTYRKKEVRKNGV